MAVAAAVITLPMLYNYVQFFQSHLLIETDYCKVSQRFKLKTIDSKLCLENIKRWEAIFRGKSVNF